MTPATDETSWGHIRQPDRCHDHKAIRKRGVHARIVHFLTGNSSSTTWTSMIWLIESVHDSHSRHGFRVGKRQFDFRVSHKVVNIVPATEPRF